VKHQISKPFNRRFLTLRKEHFGLDKWQ